MRGASDDLMRGSGRRLRVDLFTRKAQPELLAPRPRQPGSEQRGDHVDVCSCNMLYSCDIFEEDGSQAAVALEMDATLDGYMAACESAFIRAALLPHQGHISGTAHAPGISRKSLWEDAQACDCGRIAPLRQAGDVNFCRTARMQFDDNDGTLETLLVRVKGTVQGIGYREACVRRATELDVTGWVRNRMDGSVEAMLQGTRKNLAVMCTWLSEGMSAALVDELEVTKVQPPFARFDHFERLPTL
jgi:acylphosphatase